MKNFQEKTKTLRLSAVRRLIFGLFVFSLAPALSAQDLPGKIRGYKVHGEKIFVTDDLKKTSKKVEIKLGEPEIADVSASGVTVELGGEIKILGQSGRVDFISFKDFRVNGVKVEVEEYREAFRFKKNTFFKFEKPFKINISPAQTLRAAWNEAENPTEQWLVTGKIFVFGRFEKFGFSFKRVVPVEVSMKIANPLERQKTAAPLRSN